MVNFIITNLDPTIHDRSKFNSSSTELNNYLQNQATQDIRRSLANCNVSSPNSNYQSNETDQTNLKPIAGYSTLSASSLAKSELPYSMARKIGYYSSLPSVLIGRLAVDQSYQGLGIGRSLLVNSLMQACTTNQTAAVYAVKVEAKDENAINFYERFGFIKSLISQNGLFLPLEQAKKILAKIEG